MTYRPGHKITVTIPAEDAERMAEALPFASPEDGVAMLVREALDARGRNDPLHRPLPRSLVQGTTTNVSADPLHVRAHVATVSAREIDAEVRQTRDSIRKGARRTDHRFKL